jgi:peptidyl-prolyl cis-trans isomerase C
VDLFNFIQQLPPQTRQLPAEQLFPVALEQLVNGQVVQQKTDDVNLENDPEVQKQMEEIKDNVMREVYLKRLIDERLTEDRLKSAYNDYVESFPAVEEVKASHILVKEEAKAQELLKQLEGGSDFAELAKANSTDGTAQNGGDLGYFAKTDVVAPFAEAAFSTAPGSYTKTPVKSDFGYHIIKVEDKRQRPAPEYEAAKPFIEGQMRRIILDEMIQEWRKTAQIERFDINGQPLKENADTSAPAAAEPSSGEAPAAAPAETPPAAAPEAPAAP